MTQPPYVPGQQPGQVWPPNPTTGPAGPPPPRKSRLPWILAAGSVAVLLVAVLAGVLVLQNGDSGQAAAPSAWEQEQAANAKAGNVQYATAVELVSALNKAGTACAGWKAVPDPIGAKERGSCTVGTEEVTAAIFATKSEAQAEPQNKADLLAGISDVHLIVGPNWALGCDRAGLCQAIADKFGGEMVSIPSETEAATPEPAPTTAKPAKVSYAKLTDRQWKKIAKDPDSYAGKSYIVYGVVTQFDSATGTDTFRANVAARNLAESYDYDTNTILNGDDAALDDLVEDDEFRAQVTVVGAFDYETQMGGETTVPHLEVASIKVL